MRVVGIRSWQPRKDQVNICKKSSLRRKILFRASYKKIRAFRGSELENAELKFRAFRAHSQCPHRVRPGYSCDSKSKTLVKMQVFLNPQFTRLQNTRALRAPQDTRVQKTRPLRARKDTRARKTRARARKNTRVEDTRRRRK